MKTKKELYKLTSMLLAIILVLSLNPAIASAADNKYNLAESMELHNSLSTTPAALEFYKQPSVYIESDNPAIISKAVEITSGLSGDRQKAQAIHDWVANNIYYDYDDDTWGEANAHHGHPGYSPVDDTAVAALEAKRGVCSHYSMLTVALLRSIGIPALYVSGDTGVSHAWTYAYVDERWLIMDTTWDSANEWEYGRITRSGKCGQKYFDIAPETLYRERQLTDIMDFLGMVIHDNVLQKVVLLDNEISVTIPDSVTSIGEYAFGFCFTVENVTIPNGVTSIGDYAFISCWNLENITIPGSVTSIGTGAFYSCTSLSNVTIPSGVTSLSNSTFDNCASLSSVSLPAGLISIGNNAFSDCSVLKTVTIPDSVQSIGNGAFYQCSALTTVIIGSGIEEFGEELFKPHFGVPGPDLKIYGSANSVAEEYAQNNNFLFSTGFSLDTASSWAHNSIGSAFAKGFIPGSLQDSYSNVITRAEFSRMAVNFIEYKTGSSIASILNNKNLSRNPRAFSDTNDGYVISAYALGIINGTKAPTDTTPGKFNPKGAISREQAATMIKNVCELIGIDTNSSTVSGFTDIDTASSWALSGINFCYINGIMSGTSTTPLVFSPKGTYTRQESIVTFDNIK